MIFSNSLASLVFCYGKDKLDFKFASLCEKCPNTEFFLVHSFPNKSPYSVRVRENKDQKELCIWTLFTQ